MTQLYETEIINIKGTQGHSDIKDGLSFQVSSPLEADRDGLNPEQFMGLAWSTCLNATIMSLLKGRNLSHLDSKVRVIVKMMKEEAMAGYYFEMKAIVSIQSLNLEDTMKMAIQADKFCPVSKLISKNPHVTLEVEKY